MRRSLPPSICLHQGVHVPLRSTGVAEAGVVCEGATDGSLPGRGAAETGLAPPVKAVVEVFLGEGQERQSTGSQVKGSEVRQGSH